MEIQVVNLPNGISIVHREIPHSRVVHCGFVIDAGSRDEGPEETGIAHFIEHMVFKGTQRRKTFHILNYLESVGGDVNAYTTKEKTCLYATVLPQYCGRAMELLADITFDSTFPKKEISKERKVISEEIDMYNDSPEDSILEDFEAIAYPDHSLGRPIAGTRESIAGIGREEILKFIERNYTAGRVVFSVVGKVSLVEIKKLAKKYLADLELPKSSVRKTRTPDFQAGSLEKKISGQQAHKVIGGDACSFSHDMYVPVSVLCNYLAGPANNSLLNLNIREKHGLTYNIYSFFNPFTDCGLWGIYFACEPANLNRISRMVDKELQKLKSTELGAVRLNQIKRQMIGQLTIGNEGLLSKMLVQAKNLLDFGRDYDLEELTRQVESVTAADLKAAANFLFRKEKMAEVVYLPEA